jgi:cellobiose phosphorylase
VQYRYRETIYDIVFIQQDGNKVDLSISVDGIKIQDKAIPLVDDLKRHSIEIILVQIDSRKNEIQNAK